jgi:hypothetical protein
MGFVDHRAANEARLMSVLVNVLAHRIVLHDPDPRAGADFAANALRETVKGNAHVWADDSGTEPEGTA